MTIHPGKVALTADDFVALWACGLEIDNDNQPMPDNAEPPDELEVVGEWVLPQTCHQKVNGHFINRRKWHAIIFDNISNQLCEGSYAPKKNAITINKKYLFWLGLTFFM